MRKPFLKRLTWIAIIGILVVSVLPNIFPGYWLIDIFSNFKVQYLFVSLFLLIISVILLERKIPALILIVIPILWNLYFIAPYYRKSDVAESKISDRFKISSINLLSSNSEIDLVKNYIRTENPDVLVLLEFTPEWENNLISIAETYPYKKLVARTDNFGIALLSKFEMTPSVDYFNLNNKPSIVGNLKIDNTEYTIVATHPVPPVSQATFTNRNKQLTNIINKRHSFSDNLVIVGDLNSSSFSNHFNALLKGDLKDSRIGFGLLPTWPADFKLLQTTLDHCLISENLVVLDRSTGKDIGSDHLPISTVIGVKQITAVPHRTSSLSRGAYHWELQDFRYKKRKLALP